MDLLTLCENTFGFKHSLGDNNAHYYASITHRSYTNATRHLIIALHVSSFRSTKKQCRSREFKVPSAVAISTASIIVKKFARPAGFEPVIFPVTGERVTRLHHGRMFQLLILFKYPLLPLKKQAGLLEILMIIHKII